MINFTINSTNPDEYNVIKAVLPNITNWQKITFTVTSLVTYCQIQVLDQNDYMQFKLANDKIINLTFKDAYTNIQGAEQLSGILNEGLLDTTLSVRVLSNNCLIFICDTQEFSIIKMSYNMQLLTGFYCEINEDFPINSTNKTIQVRATGFYVGTPILYLISNLGDINIHNSINQSRQFEINSVCMRIQNSSTPMMPLISSNVEFVKKICVGDITNFEMRLVDANLKDIKLLSPMWVTFSIQQVIEDERNAEDFWAFSYARQPREPPKLLFPINPEILQAIAEEPVTFS